MISMSGYFMEELLKACTKNPVIKKENMIYQTVSYIAKNHILEDAGVYKCTKEGRAAFERFIATL